MIELIKYFRILFTSAKISRDRLKDFTEDHIQRLTTNNPGGIFTAILTAVTTAYNNFYGDLSSEAVNLAVQEGKTIALGESRTALLKQLSDNEKLVAYTYKDDNDKYEEFYPLGMDEYYQATTSGLETISNRYKLVLASHAADFTAGFVTDYNTVQQTYVDNRAAQQSAFGDVAGERSDLQTTRAALALQLTTNLLTIALQYVGNESKADVYFNQAILNAAFSEAETKVEAELDPGSSMNIFDNISKASLNLRAKNNSSQAINIGFATSEDAIIANGPDTTLNAGEEKLTTAGEAGWTTEKKYLNATNYADEVISFEVEKVS